MTKILNVVPKSTTAFLFYKFQLFVDGDGLLKVKGRFTKKIIGTDSAYPNILPSKHHITNHERNRHQDQATTLNNMRKNGLGTDDMLLTLTLFLSCRGRPQQIYRENRTNFVGINKKLKKMWDQIDWTKIYNKGHVSRIESYFSPPGASNMGGA